jgi:hypothetical protein
MTLTGQGYIYSIHDRDAHPLIPAGGWCVDAVLVTDEPPNYAAIRNDINWIVRLNHGWNPQGTIPVRSGYADYAKRCADFVRRSKGVNVFIISNEPNHAQEYPHGVKIEPEDYADCFNLCYDAIKQVRAEAQVCVAAVAPWDVTSGIDWLAYYQRMLAAIDGCGGLAVHGYCHGADPDLIWSAEKVQGWFWHFPVIYQTIRAIPSKFSRLPVHVTETNQGDNAWLDRNSGYVQNAYQSVNDHNRQAGTQKVHSLSLYRWRGDKWQIHDKPGVQDDFKAAVAKGYTVESGPGPTPLPPTIEPPQPPTETYPAREIDPVLAARGVEFDFVSPSAGTGYWQVVLAEHLNEEEADAVGPDHHILGTIQRGEAIAVDVPLKVTWPSGSTTIHSKAAQSGVSYNYDFPMSSSLNEFSIWVDDGNPSDKVSGIGMGAHGNPSIHTSTWIDFEWKIAEAITPPIPPITPLPPTGAVETGVVLAPAGLNLRMGPSTNFPVLGTLSFGSTVLHDDELDGWLHVTDGWVSEDYVGDAAGITTTTPLTPPLLPGGLVHPLPGSVRTQDFYQNPQAYAQFSMPGHDGTDLAGLPAGTPILAMADGVVLRAAFDAPGYGNFVEVAHDALGATTVYAHAERNEVSVGQVVQAGQTIALLGTTGNSTGVHLHLSVRLINKDGSYREDCPMRKGRVDPRTWAAMHNLKL